MSILGNPEDRVKGREADNGFKLQPHIQKEQDRSLAHERREEEFHQIIRSKIVSALWMIYYSRSLKASQALAIFHFSVVTFI